MSKEDFLRGLKFLGLAYNKNFDEQETSVWYSFFNDVKYDDFRNAIKRLIPIKQFLPSISELRKECDLIKDSRVFEILEFMKKDGYFKKGQFGDLDEVQQFRNYEKATRWLNSGEIPEWFEKDVSEYENRLKQTKLLEVANE